MPHHSSGPHNHHARGRNGNGLSASRSSRAAAPSPPLVDDSVAQCHAIVPLRGLQRDIAAANIGGDAPWLALERITATTSTGGADLQHVARLQHDRVDVPEALRIMPARIDDHVREAGRLSAEHAPRPEEATVAVPCGDTRIRREDRKAISVARPPRQRPGPPLSRARPYLTNSTGVSVSVISIGVFLR